MSEQEEQAGEEAPDVEKDLLGEPVKEKKIRKARSTPRFVTARVEDLSDDGASVGSLAERWTPVDQGKSKQDCEKRAARLDDGRYVVVCVHSVLELKSELVKTVKREKR